VSHTHTLPIPCVACLGDGGGMLQSPLPALGDAEGAALPDGLPPVVDGHVHLFHDRLFEALWRWFDKHAWPIRYRLYARQVIDFQLARGVERIVALHYAHGPGMAREMNAFVAGLCREEPRVVGLATVFPGEPDAAGVLQEAFAAGLAGVKLHCHVQCVAPDDPVVAPIYEACASAGRPLVLHAGREPKSPAYKCDPHAICGVGRIERVLRDWPGLKLVVPHLGVDETEAYVRLLDRYENLWLDTTMVVAGYFPQEIPLDVLAARPDRVLYGTDFPNLPYAWDRELHRLLERELRAEALEAVLGGTAKALYGLRPLPAG
jgi:predicted TIM-barrel fold metal-dependent hydrolase